MAPAGAPTQQQPWGSPQPQPQTRPWGAPTHPQQPPQPPQPPAPKGFLPADVPNPYISDWTNVAPPAPRDPAAGHVLRWLGVTLFLLCFTPISLVVLAFAMGATGRRKRDILQAFVPIWGAYVVVSTLWRWTARSVTWSTRRDRDSSVLSGFMRPAMVGGGYVLFPAAAFAAVLAVSALLSTLKEDLSWDAEAREQVVAEFVAAGIERPTAECLQQQIEGEFEILEMLAPGAMDSFMPTAIENCRPA